MEENKAGRRKEESSENKEIRLNKYLSEMGICSRREADRLIEGGSVLVDGKPAVTGMKIAPGQEVVCDGKTVGGGKRPAPVLLAVHKPRGVVCTTSDNDRAMNIVEMVDYPERVYPVGRLDKDSEGLILMTNQGGLVNKILRASNMHEKEYVVTIDRMVTAGFLKDMRKGVWLEELGVATKPCVVEWTGKREFRIVLTQGLNRQIRRMCQALGCHVLELRRVRIMNLRLGNLKAGTYRKVAPEEYKELLKLLDSSTSLPTKERKKTQASPKKKEHYKNGRK